MENAHLILLWGIVVCSIGLPISVFFSHGRIYEMWAKIISVLACVFGLGAALIGFVFVYWGISISWSMRVAFCLAHTLLGGIWIGLALSIIIAKPYKKVTFEKSQPLT